MFAGQLFALYLEPIPEIIIFQPKILTKKHYKYIIKFEMEPVPYKRICETRNRRKG